MLRAALVALILLAAAPAWADRGASERTAQLARAISALEAGRAAEARRLLKPLTNDGSAVAETLLGGLHFRGLGGPRDAATAVGYWWRAAQRGYAPAQLALARSLATGQGVTASPAAAYRWGLLAARSGDRAVRRAAERLCTELARSLGPRRAERIAAKAATFRPWSPTE